jgi:hypothetical protein
MTLKQILDLIDNNEYIFILNKELSIDPRDENVYSGLKRDLVSIPDISVTKIFRGTVNNNICILLKS